MLHLKEFVTSAMFLACGILMLVLSNKLQANLLRWFWRTGRKEAKQSGMDPELQAQFANFVGSRLFLYILRFIGAFGVLWLRRCFSFC